MFHFFPFSIFKRREGYASRRTASGCRRRPEPQKLRRCAGFTIVELIVAAGVFVVITTIAVGVFINVVRDQRRLVTLMAVNNNAGGVLEQMAREIRTGYRFCENRGQNPGSPCNLSTESELQFTNHASSTVRYKLNTSSGVITRVQDNGAEQALTAGEVEVTYLSFTVRQLNQNGSGGDDVCNPWRITIGMGVRPRGDTDTAREVRLQTTVSSRVLPAEAPNAPESIIRACPL